MVKEEFQILLSLKQIMY